MRSNAILLLDLPLPVLPPRRVLPVAPSSEGSSRRTSRIRSFRLTLIGCCVPDVGADPVDGPGRDSCIEAAELTKAVEVAVVL